MKGFNFFNILYAGRQGVLINARESLLNCFSYLYVKIYLGFLLTINLFTWLSSRYIKVNIGTEQIALHYNVDFGIDYYDSTDKIYIIPLLGLLIIIINFLLFVCLSSHKDRRFISHLLLGAATTTNIILLIAIITIYLVNFS